MGKLEQAGKRKSKRKNINGLILNTIAIAGVISIAVVAPNVIGAMGKLGLLPGKRQKEIINRARDRLLSQGLLSRENGQLRVTKKGEQVLRSDSDFLRLHHTPKRWDGKWRLLAFDIPERRRTLRDKIRNTLRTIGFVRLQNSMWVYPHDCEDLIALLKVDFKVGKDMLYLIVEEMEGSAELKRSFGLH